MSPPSCPPIGPFPPTSSSGSSTGIDEDTWMSTSHPHFTRLFTFCIFLIVFGGIMSGLQQAVMQVNPAQLASMRRDGSEAERKVATLLGPLVKRRHLTLVCLLIGNAMAMEALPVFMDFLVPKFAAILLSVTAVVLFSEIIPQAMCLRWPLELAGLFSWLMYLLVAVLYPVAAPIAWILDKLFGKEHEALLSKGGLRELVLNHAKAHGAEGSVLTSDEVSIMVGVLDLHKQKVGDAMTPVAQVRMLSEDQRLDDTTLKILGQDGHSRVPIHANGDPSHVTGLLLVKSLLRIERHLRVKDLDIILPILVVDQSVSLFTLLHRFCRGESHMAVVVEADPSFSGGNEDTSETHPTSPIAAGGGKSPRGNEVAGIRLCDPFMPETHAHGVVGVVTLEDVLEKLLRIDIKDEKDVWKPAQDDIESRLGKLDMLSKMLKRTSSSQISGASYGSLL